jgi:hypothetical protein
MIGGCNWRGSRHPFLIWLRERHCGYEQKKKRWSSPPKSRWHEAGWKNQKLRAT